MPANPLLQGDERIRTAVTVKPGDSRDFLARADSPGNCPQGSRPVTTGVCARDVQQVTLVAGLTARLTAGESLWEESGSGQGDLSPHPSRGTSSPLCPETIPQSPAVSRAGFSYKLGADLPASTLLLAVGAPSEASDMTDPVPSRHADSEPSRGRVARCAAAPGDRGEA